MSQVVIPPEEGPKVKFEHDPAHRKAPAIGMENIPDNVLRALVTKMSREEDQSEQEIFSRLTDEYGGDMLSNDLRIYKLLGD